MPRFLLNLLQYDPVVLELLGERSDLAECLLPVFADIAAGRRDLVKLYISERIYSLDACGLRLWIAISPNRREAEITGYQWIRSS